MTPISFQFPTTMKKLEKQDSDVGLLFYCLERYCCTVIRSIGRHCLRVRSINSTTKMADILTFYHFNDVVSWFYHVGPGLACSDLLIM